ncbi:potassium channel [Abditibacteriota bacterium]|nr:potassium channel [Abditibacteriota bacterium]
MAAEFSGISKARFEAFSDGVFAIAITLLVLELRVHGNLPVDKLRDELIAQLPRLGAYILTFLSLGVFWVAHHLMLGAASRVDRLLLWLNNFFLMFVTLLPFSAGVLGSYTHSRDAVAIYGLNMTLIEIFLIWIWVHIVRHLKREDVSPLLVRSGFRRTFAGLGIYVFGALLGLSGLPLVGIALFWAAPVSYILLQTFVDHRPHARARIRP